jgi:hypothetical protein
MTKERAAYWIGKFSETRDAERNRECPEIRAYYQTEIDKLQNDLNNYHYGKCKIG